MKLVVFSRKRSHWTVLFVFWLYTVSTTTQAVTSVSCFASFQQLVQAGISPIEAARQRQVFRLATEEVHDRFVRLKNDPAFEGRSDRFLWQYAQDLVRASLPREAHEAFDRAANLALQGWRNFDRNLEIFNHPERYLSDEHALTPRESQQLIDLAWEFVTRSGRDTANASHLADHLAVILEPENLRLLEQMGISREQAVLNVLLHDLGKEMAQLPQSTQAHFNRMFPPRMVNGRDVNFLPRHIMGHEFGSMDQIEVFGRQIGLSQEKINRLKALIARHNAGYDPTLAGFHFWVASFAWGNFANRARALGFALPESYTPLLPTNEGGHPSTVILTAIDRGTSLTLASQEKFAPALIAGAKWNNDGLAQQMSGNATNVLNEVRNVLERLQPPPGANGQAYRAMAERIVSAFSVDRVRLETLARELPRMASAEGPYADRPAMTVEELNNSIVYRNRQGRWYRVLANGTLFESRNGQWVTSTLSPTDPTDAPGILFRLAINPDFGYRPRQLSGPFERP